MAKKAVVLLSGGLDSTTVLAFAKSEGYGTYALSFRYGQRHETELTAATRVAEAMGVEEHLTASVDLTLFGGSSLTADIDVPKRRSDDEMATGIPSTYVPARNTVFLSLALAWAEVLKSKTDIFIGVNALDYSGYPDCRPEFVQAYEQMANCRHQRSGRRTPTHKDSRATDGVDQGRHHPPRNQPRGRLQPYPQLLRPRCGRSLLRYLRLLHLRLKGFREAGIADPIPYQETLRDVA